MSRWLLDPLAYDFMRRALLAALLVGALAPLVGTWVVLRRMAYLGDAMGHATLGGVAVAYLLGASLTLGALGAGLTMAAIIAVLGRHPGLREDTIIGTAQLALFAVGLLVIAKADTGALDLSHVLLGSITTVTAADLQTHAVLAAVVLVVVVLTFDDLRSATFDASHAQIAGVAVHRLDALLLAVLATVIVLALQTVGILLSFALLVVPAATARLWTRTVTAMSALAVLIGVFCAIGGLYLSWHLATPPGATVALLCVAALTVSVAASRPRRAAPPLAHLP